MKGVQALTPETHQFGPRDHHHVAKQDLNSQRGVRKLALALVLGSLLQSATILVIVVALLGPSASRWPERLSGGSASNGAAISTAQHFLRLVAGDEINLACTQVIEPGLLNPCMDDLRSRDLTAISQAGSSVLVTSVEVTGSKALVVGRDTRPAIEGNFALGLQWVEQQWLVETLNGMKIVGSP